MNERIRELAEASIKCVKYRIDQFTLKQIDDPDGPYIRTEFDREKFAELIVKECAHVGFNAAYPLRGTEVLIGIEKHFGLREHECAENVKR